MTTNKKQERRPMRAMPTTASHREFVSLDLRVKSGHNSRPSNFFPVSANLWPKLRMTNPEVSMLKRAFSLLIICLGWVAIATAQNGTTSQTGAQADVANQVIGLDAPLGPPPYCPPAPAVPRCVFYAGDFKPQPAKQPNGLFNQIFHDGANTIDGQVWVPITVKKKIMVQSLFVNELFASPPPMTALAHWEIRNGVSAGNGGAVQCSGSGVAIATPTGRTFVFGGTTYTEYNYMLNLAPQDYCELWNPAPPSAPTLEDQPSGGKGGCPPHCYMAVTTEDSSGAEASAADAPLTLNFGYLSAVPNPAPHHFGLPNVYDNSFFKSTFYGKNFVPATTACAAGPPVAITKVGCHMFSVGIVGSGR